MKNADQETRKQYWQKFTKACEDHKAPLKPHAPSGALNSLDVNFGPNLNLNLRVSAVLGATQIPGYANPKNITIRISVTCELWETLEKAWNEIKSKFDNNELKHRLLDEKGNFPGGQQIFLYKEDTNPTDESDWQQQFNWFILNFWKFAEIFREYFCPSFEPFDRPFEFNKPSNKHSEENINRHYHVLIVSFVIL